MIYRLLGITDRTRLVSLIGMMLIGNILEVFGLTLLIPIIELFQGKESSISRFTAVISGFVTRLGIKAELPAFLVLFCLLFLIKGALMLWIRHVSVKMAANMQHDLRMRLLGGLLLANAGFVHEYKQGALLSVLGDHIIRTGQLLFLAVQLVTQWMTVAAYLIFVLFVSWKLTSVSLVFGALLAPVILWMGRKANWHGKEYTHLQEEAQHRALEGLQAKKLVNAMNWRDALERRYGEISTGVRDHWQWMAYWSNGQGLVIQPLSVIILSLIIWLSMRFNLSVAMLGGFVLAFTRLLPAVQAAVAIGGDIQANKPSIERVFELLEQVESAREHCGSVPFEGMKRAIKLEDVHFRYPGRDSLINGLDLEFPKGATVALVGRSGVGKTTIVDLLIGLYLPEAGRIMIDNTDLVQIDLRQYRKRIAYVPQEAVLFHDTIRNNLIIGLERRVSDEELRAVCEQAGAWEFIVARTDGMDALIGDRGVQLSGGQRQRLALARALLREPEILILDEATSALDLESERWITRTLTNLQDTGRLTIIVIAHRYNTIRHADRIVEISHDGAKLLGNWQESEAYLLRESQSLTIS